MKKNLYILSHFAIQQKLITLQMNYTSIIIFLMLQFSCLDQIKPIARFLKNSPGAKPNAEHFV